MDMVEVFEKQVIEITKQKMNDALEKLKRDEPVQREFRELAEIISKLDRINFALRKSSNHYKDRQKWITKSDDIRTKRNRIYRELEELGFKQSWIEKIVNFEIEKLDKIMHDAREDAYMKSFGTTIVDDIDIFDSRWELVGQYMAEAKSSYIEGKIFN
ncbi:hypothetical protein [Oceanobacillus sp. 1P07AA]|uniref:hypothetical protein n=1 Tax=Oceanobacillus sp. 1P07AA TaxID=3132293 RepID=UPI0039A5611F